MVQGAVREGDFRLSHRCDNDKLGPHARLQLKPTQRDQDDHPPRFHFYHVLTLAITHSGFRKLYTITMRFFTGLPLILLALVSTAQAQFGFFEQMFGGQQQERKPQNVPSDSGAYRNQYDHSYCEQYLCPDTLACVHFPHHCPCPWPSHQDKFELADGQRICVSKGGFAEGEAARKLELARKGML